jgi:hypothetical protein
MTAAPKVNSELDEESACPVNDSSVSQRDDGGMKVVPVRLFLDRLPRKRDLYSSRQVRLMIDDQLATMKLMKAMACCCSGVAVERTGM